MNEEHTRENRSKQNVNTAEPSFKTTLKLQWKI